MYAATSNRKGTDVLEYMRVNLNVDLEPMSEFSGRMEKEARRFNEANVVIAPTRHEGNSYLLLDAIACGVPIVTYATGYAMEMDERVGYITDDISPENFRRLMNLVLEKDQEEWIDSVRGFAEEHCDYERFADEWREYVEYDAG
jgi:glycosyltransferase involved in cell wall biosynthesis